MPDEIDDSRGLTKPQKAARRCGPVNLLVVLLLVAAPAWYFFHELAEKIQWSSSGGKRRVYDCVIITAASGAELSPRISRDVAARLDTALGHHAETEFFLVLSRGSTSKPSPLDEDGLAVDEAKRSARYLLERGVESRRILIAPAPSSNAGIANAAIARLMHADLRGWKSLLIISAQHELPITKLVFDWVFALPPARGGGMGGGRGRGLYQRPSEPVPTIEYEVSDQSHLHTHTQSTHSPTALCTLLADFVVCAECDTGERGDARR